MKKLAAQTTGIALPTAIALALLASFAAALPAGATVIAPTVFTDDDTVNGNCTLREATEAAVTNLPVDACPAGEPPPVVDQVQLAAGSYMLSLAPQVDITEDVAILGAGQTATDLSGSGNLGLLRVPFGVSPTVTLADLTLHDAHTQNRGGCLAMMGGTAEITDVTFDNCSADVDGGAISSEQAIVNLTRVTLTNNRAGADGGAIAAFFPSSSTTLIDSLVVGNRSEPPTGFKNGGGIFQRSGTLTVTRTVISGNRSSLGGGISANNATVLLTDVTLDRNFAGNGGGGIRDTQQSTITLVRTTVSHNRSNVRGGGIRMTTGEIFVVDSTVSANRAPVGGGFFNNNGRINLLHSTVAHNVAQTGEAVYDTRLADGVFLDNTLVLGHCWWQSSPPTSQGGNLESPASTCGLDQVDDQDDVANPAVTALADHGGLTRTHLLLPGSPAIDAARAADCTASGQRGNSRPLDGDGVGGAECDVGSVEVMLGEDAPIFADGFESGDLLQWTEAVAAGAALAGLPGG